MSLDALASSHAISLPVTHPKQIKEIFDSITYRKVSSYRLLFKFHQTLSFSYEQRNSVDKSLSLSLLSENFVFKATWEPRKFWSS